MYTENAQKAIDLQLMVNHQIDTYEQAQSELVDELEEVFDNLTDDEIESVLEWYKTQKSAEEELMAQWDM